jgi:tripartite-type tricarboxylate transporter receptor subunit TctC
MCSRITPRIGMLGIFPEVIAISQLTEPRISKWNVRDFTYIGAFANSNGVFVVRKDAPAVTVEDMRSKTSAATAAPAQATSIRLCSRPMPG